MSSSIDQSFRKFAHEFIEGDVIMVPEFSLKFPSHESAQSARRETD